MNFAWAATYATSLLLFWSLFEGDAWRERGWAICADAPAVRDRGPAARRALHRTLFASAAIPSLLGLFATHDVGAPQTWLAASLALLIIQGLTIAATIDEGANEIPDAVTIPLFAVSLLVSGSGVLDGAFGSPRAAMIGAGAGLALGGLLPAALGRDLQAVGGADVLLLGTIGAMVGLVGLAVAVLVAGLATMLLRPLLQRHDGALPYAPGLALGFGSGAAAASWLSI
jgi:prepilin signal peptidase PulO-like enzyme (type II secretory pathway)